MHWVSQKRKCVFVVVNLLFKINIFSVALLFYNFSFSPFTEVLQVRDTMMCDSSWSIVYAAICAYKAKAENAVILYNSPKFSMLHTSSG